MEWMNEPHILFSKSVFGGGMYKALAPSEEPHQI